MDADRARICRVALPALEPAGARIALIRTGATTAGIRVDYRRSLPDAPPSVRFASCRFDPGGELVGITTDDGEVAGATVYLLKRHYIDSPEGIAADPGPPAPDADLPAMPARLAPLLQHVLLGLPSLAIYGLLAAAYGLVFGLVGRINLAFGEIAAIGAAGAGLAIVGIGTDGPALLVAGAVAAGLAVALASAGLHSAVAGHAAFALVPSGRAQASLIATVGLSLALSEYLRLVRGPVPAWIRPLGPDPWPIARAGEFVVTAGPVGLGAAAIGFAAALGLLALMRRSRFGREWRAVADEPLAAALVGIDGQRVLLATLALSGALAGLAGALVAIRFGALGYADGFGLGLKALAAAILGGIGSVTGALLGGLAIGAFELAWSAYGPIAWRDLALQAVLVAAIVLRPRGLTGSGETRFPRWRG